MSTLTKGLDEKGFPVIGTIWGDPISKEIVDVLYIDLPENDPEGNGLDWRDYCSEDDPEGLEFTGVTFESSFFKDEDFLCGTSLMDFLKDYEYLGLGQKRIENEQ